MSVMPLYNVLVLPGAKFWLHTNVYRELAGKDPEQGERVTLLMQKADQERRSLNADSFYPIGLTGAVSEIDENGFLAVDLESRINIDEITLLKNRSFSITATRRPDFGILDETDAAERLAAVKDRILTMARGQRWEGMLRNFASRWDSLWTVAAAMSPFLTVSAEERYALLSDDDVKKRFEAVERILFEGLELVDVQSEARTAQREDHEKLYRESAIRKQIEYLQKELDEMHPENVSELRRLELQLEGAGMNESALKEGRKVLNRLKGESANSPEAGMLTDWLDLLTGLPWKKAVPEPISMEEAETVLNADHAGLEKVKERILQQIAVIRLKGRQAGSILCFVGAPGTGKTSIGESIARALKRKYVRISLGGVHDESDIRGHRRTYIGAMPGRIIDGIHKCGSSNPVIVLDEVDKLFSSYQGDPASALLEVLDPEQNFSFTDHYLNVPFDLSDVLFICTANTVDTIPSPLLDRMEVIPFRGYTPIEKHKIAREHLLPKALNAIAIPEGSLSVDDGAIEALIDGYTREAGVRGLKKCFDRIARAAAVKLVDHPEEKITVRTEDLPEYLDASPMHLKRVSSSGKPGIVTGLAWTPAGGDVLYIQTLFTKGSGKIAITGQLGDVMRESVEIAVSLVKSIFPDSAHLFQENDLHIHVPDGATPKDGPSAGITITAALASLVSGTPVPADTAMTGEVSLRGDVNPVGGLPEKLMAAQRSGVRRVFLPEDNLDDLREVAEEVKTQIEILPVSSVEEVLSRLVIPFGSASGKAL